MNLDIYEIFVNMYFCCRVYYKLPRIYLVI